jgi:hypothetical protein
MTRPDGLARSRDGDLIDQADDLDQAPTPHTCTAGWLTEDPPRPCPRCRPATADRIADQRRRHTPDWTPSTRSHR